jgi:hypothetical protein
MQTKQAQKFPNETDTCFKRSKATRGKKNVPDTPYIIKIVMNGDVAMLLILDFQNMRT